jgi:ABC-2 type transport system ATP-binding protein
MKGTEAIAVHDLHKSFGDIHAVDGIDFEVARGEIFSLLGPNGAGKSTAISMLACLLQPDAGDAEVMGHSVTREPMAVKDAIGVVPQDVALYADLSARENLTFWGKMYGLRGEALARRVDDVLDLTGLTERQKGRVDKYSGGMKRRLNIGIALLHKPPVLVMDEPTVGIDPQSRRNILDGVKDLNRQGITVLYTTHYMEEAQELSDHIAIMNQGKIIARGTHDELVQIVGELDRIDLILQMPLQEAGPSAVRERLLARWQGLAGVERVFSAAEGSEETESDTEEGTEADLVVLGDGHVSLLVEDSNLVLPPIFESAVDAGVRITSVEIHEPNLEAVFLHLTGRALRD